MAGAKWIAKGVARLFAVVLLCVCLTLFGYLAMLAVVMRFPPHAIQ